MRAAASGALGCPGLAHLGRPVGLLGWLLPTPGSTVGVSADALVQDLAAGYEGLAPW